MNGWGTEFAGHLEDARLVMTALAGVIRGVPRQRYVEAVLIAVLVTLANTLITVPVLREEIASSRRERDILVRNRDAQIAEIKSAEKELRNEQGRFEQQVLQRLAAIEVALTDIKARRP